jgi:hypothetical protein
MVISPLSDLYFLGQGAKTAYLRPNIPQQVAAVTSAFEAPGLLQHRMENDPFLHHLVSFYR